MTVNVTEALDRDGALEALRARRFDCALVDAAVAETDGCRLVRDLRKKSGPPVVAFAREWREPLLSDVVNAGAADLVDERDLTHGALERCLRYASTLAAAERRGRQLLEREKVARAEADAAARAAEEWLATISHELRTPLNAILGWSRLMAGGKLPPPTVAHAIAVIERNARLQAQLVEDLLNASHLLTGQTRLVLRPAGVAAIVEAAAEAAGPAAAAKHILVDLDISGAPDRLVCDPERVRQIIWHLLSNALKFTPDGGRIRLAAARDDGYAVFEVSDTGTGIEPGFLPFVFDRFRQEDGATTRTRGGVGLGLSIVKHLVELHGGSVSAESDGPGAGARFTVRLPRAE